MLVGSTDWQANPAFSSLKQTNGALNAVDGESAQLPSLAPPPETNGVPNPIPTPSLPMSNSTPTTATGGGSGGGGGLPSITTNYSIDLGYAVTVGLGLLVLLSTIVLASYVCCRPSRQRRNQQNPNTTTSNNGVILPRGIFVADDDDDNNAAVGIDPAVINSYPKFPFSKDHGGGVNDSTCSICLCEYGDAEMLRMLPDCRHCFHLACVDAWLKLNASCPVCRNSPLPTPRMIGGGDDSGVTFRGCDV